MCSLRIMFGAHGFQSLEDQLKNGFLSCHPTSRPRLLCLSQGISYAPVYRDEPTAEVTFVPDVMYPMQKLVTYCHSMLDSTVVQTT